MAKEAKRSPFSYVFGPFLLLRSGTTALTFYIRCACRILRFSSTIFVIFRPHQPMRRVAGVILKCDVTALTDVFAVFYGLVPPSSLYSDHISL